MDSTCEAPLKVRTPISSLALFRITNVRAASSAASNRAAVHALARVEHEDRGERSRRPLERHDREPSNEPAVFSHLDVLPVQARSAREVDEISATWKPYAADLDELGPGVCARDCRRGQETRCCEPHDHDQPLQCRPFSAPGSRWMPARRGIGSVRPRFSNLCMKLGRKPVGWSAPRTVRSSSTSSILNSKSS